MADPEDEDLQQQVPVPAAAAAPPPVIRVYDGVKDRLFQSSPLAVLHHQEKSLDYIVDSEFKHYQKRVAESETHRLVKSLKPKTKPPDLDEWNRFVENHPQRAWKFVCESLEPFVNIKEIPYKDYSLTLEYACTLSEILEWLDMLPPSLPLSSTTSIDRDDNNGEQQQQQLLLLERLGHIGNTVWRFYLRHRRQLKQEVNWFLLLCRIRKIAVEKVTSLHGEFLQHYNHWKVGETLVPTVLAASSVDSERRDMKWLYLLTTFEHGFVGKPLPDFMQRPFHQSTITQCVPSWSVRNKDGNAATTTNNKNNPTLPSQRMQCCKVSLDKILAEHDDRRRKRIASLTLQESWMLLTLLHSRWHELEWTPDAEYLVLLLWHHFQVLILDDHKSHHLYDSAQYLKTKPPPPSTTTADSTSENHYRRISNRFIKDLECLFMNQLEVIRAFYTFTFHALRSSVHTLDNELIVRIAEHPEQVPIVDPHQPQGLVDTLCFPQNQCFMPCEALVEELEKMMALIFLKKRTLIAGIDTQAAWTFYHKTLPQLTLIPGDSETVANRNPSLMLSPARILDQTRRGEVAPVAEMTFLTQAALIAIGFIRGGNKFPEFLSNPRHARLAIHSYVTMLQACLHIGEYKMANYPKQSVFKQHLDNKKKRKRTNGDNGNTKMTQQQRERERQEQETYRFYEQQVEPLRSYKSYFRVCNDEMNRLIYSLEDDKDVLELLLKEDGDNDAMEVEATAAADNGNRQLNYVCIWPRFRRPRGENWLIGRCRRDGTFFFMRTIDIIEAQVANEAHIKKQFGDRPTYLQGTIPQMIARHMDPLFKITPPVNM